MRSLKTIPSMIIILALLFVLTACGGKSSAVSSNIGGEQEEISLKWYELELIIEYEENFILAKYDVTITVDGKTYGTLKQGETFDEIIQLEEGAHFIRINNNDDSTITESLLITMDEDKVVSFSLKAHRDSIDINNQKELAKEKETESELETNSTTDLFDDKIGKNKNDKEKENREEKELTAQASQETTAEGEATQAETTSVETEAVVESHDYSMYPADLQEYIARCEAYATKNISDSFVEDYTFDYSSASAWTSDYTTVISELINGVPYVEPGVESVMELYFLNKDRKSMTFTFTNEYGGQLKLKYVYKEEYGSSPYKSPKGKE